MMFSRVRSLFLTALVALVVCLPGGFADAAGAVWGVSTGLDRQLSQHEIQSDSQGDIMGNVGQALTKHCCQDLTAQNARTPSGPCSSDCPMLAPSQRAPGGYADGLFASSSGGPSFAPPIQRFLRPPRV
ncbi:MAG: hypothetical protein AAGH60_06640 [Pseudomonadota bacterium]